MEKTCANHPESMALASCKACEKSICLMCVMDEKEGTFCSTQCHRIYSEVAGWTDGAPPGAAAGEPAAEADPAFSEPEAPTATQTPPPSMPDKQESIFEIEPDAAASADPEPLVAPGTKWRMIGAMCVDHDDTPAVATCDGCDKTLCALCLTETTNGTFCNNCVSGAQPKAEEQVLAKAAAAPVPGRVSTSAAGRSRGSPAPKIIAAVLAVALAAGAYFVFAGPKKEDPKPPKPPVAVNPPDVTPTPPDPNVNPPKPEPPKPPKPEPPKPEPPKPEPPKPPRPEPPKPPKPPKPEPPKPPDPPKPEPVILGRVTQPWGRESKGAWFRFRTTVNGLDVYVDQGLKEKDANSYVLLTQKARKGEASPEAAAETKVELAPYQVKAEEAVQLEDRKLLCEIREERSGGLATQTWVLIEGIHAGAVLKKMAGEKPLYIARRFWDHTLRVGARPYDCIVIEGERAGDAGMLPVKTWYSNGVPGGILREESVEGSTSLVAAGDDWATRPPFPQ